MMLRGGKLYCVNYYTQKWGSWWSLTINIENARFHSVHSILKKYWLVHQFFVHIVLYSEGRM
jgi:hypothetical protein